jgi:hypothetical protein
MLQELLQRISKLEAKEVQWERLEIQVNRMEKENLKMESQMSYFRVAKDRPHGKENETPNYRSEPF